MSIPPYKPSPLEQHLNEIVNQRNNAETARVFDYVQTAYPHLSDVFPSLGNRKPSETPGFVKTMHKLLVQLSGKKNLFNKRTKIPDGAQGSLIRSAWRQVPLAPLACTS